MFCGLNYGNLAGAAIKRWFDLSAAKQRAPCNNLGKDRCMPAAADVHPAIPGSALMRILSRAWRAERFLPRHLQVRTICRAITRRLEFRCS
jgi:hypothetical protein